MEIKHAERSCSGCGSNSAMKLTEVDFLKDECPLPIHYDIVSCSECGCCYADMDASQQIYDLYYEKYNNYAYDSKVKLATLHDTPYEVIYKAIRSVTEKDSKIIDIGCGGGEILHFLREDGYTHVFGLDPSDQAVRYLNGVHISGIKGNIFDTPDPVNIHAYDMVISTCVMEHVYDVNRYVEQLKLYMRKSPEARLLLSVPSVEGFPKHITPKPNYFNREHINFFSIYSLDHIMLNHGLSRVNKVYKYYYKDEEYIYGIYQPTWEKKNGLQRDEAGTESIKAYLAQWAIKESEIDAHVDRLLARDQRLIVFGIGSYLEWMLTKYPKLKEKIVFGVDNNMEKQNSLFAGIPIYGVDKIMEHPDKLIMICSMLYADQIRIQLENMNVQNEMITM